MSNFLSDEIVANRQVAVRSGTFNWFRVSMYLMRLRF